MARHKFLRFTIPVVVVCALWLVYSGCQSYPRYSNTTAYEKPRRSAEEEEPREQRESRIDQALMARIIDDYLGTPYQNGGSTVDGIDCSNLVRNIYYELDGSSLPPDARRMFRAGSAVERDNLLFGDLVFFAFGTRGPSHVGLYIGNGKFVHASESRGVIVSSMNETVYAEAYRGARRID